MEMMMKENQCFYAILQGCLISFFDHNSKIIASRCISTSRIQDREFFLEMSSATNLSFVRFDIVK